MTSPNPERLRSASEPDMDSGEFGTRELMAISQIAQAFHTAKRPEEVFQFALDRVSPLVGASFSCVYAIDDGQETMRLAAVHNWPQRYAKFLRQMKVRVGSGPSGEAAAERRTIEVLDVFADPTLGDWQEVAMELGFRSFVALPLQTANAVLGAVTFYFASASSLSAETRQLMQLVANQMAASADKARLIEDLKRQNADLIEARRVKDEFLANISHELRTPLTAVMGYISLMQEGLAGPINPEQSETLDSVRGASEHLLALIGDLLDLTALKRGTVGASAEALDPRDPLRDAIASALGPREGVRFEVVEPEEVPVMRSDRRMVARAVTALLDNAFKFTREGTVRASVEVTDHRVAYVIEDTGVGIPEDAQAMVFDEFRQADGSTTREFSGSGLGLSLARRLARLAQGDITLTSAPGVGSTFRLEVPLVIENGH